MGLVQSIVLRAQHALLARKLGALGRYSRIIQPALMTGTKGIHLGNGVRIWPHARIECISAGGRRGVIRIGDDSSAQMYFHCAAAESVTIGRSVLIAGRVYISDHDHAWPEGGTALVVSPVVIGDRCWLGEGCAVLKGVTIGDGCVVGANAVVTRSAPAGSMLVGVPARVIKRFDAATGRWASAEPHRSQGQPPCPGT